VTAFFAVGLALLVLVHPPRLGVPLPRLAPFASAPYDAAAAILVDPDTGQVLEARVPDDPRPIASLTKLMTALVVVERVDDLNEEVTVSPAAVAIGGGTVGLEAGERRTVGELLTALLLPSANDAAVALAEHVAGNEAAFVGLMNARAAGLRMDDSTFVSSHGLDEGTVSSARDVATLLRAALGQPTVAQLLATRLAVIPGPDGPRAVENRNELLGSYPGTLGGKTGSTAAAGECLAVAAARDRHRALAVVLGSRAAATAARTLLDHAFDDYEPVTIEPGRPVGAVVLAGRDVAVEAGGWVRVLVPKGSDVDLAIEPFAAAAPSRSGAVVGVLHVRAEGEQVGMTTVVVIGPAPDRAPALGPQDEHVRERLAALERRPPPSA
jgi:D-alanyl-D-alanine carboxypeptidase (penicillin-binding protein 5/6)